MICYLSYLLIRVYLIHFQIILSFNHLKGIRFNRGVKSSFDNYKMNEPVEKIVDSRCEFLKEVTLRSLRVKSEKWDRLFISDEQRSFIMGFVERQTPQVILVNMKKE